MALTSAGNQQNDKSKELIPRLVEGIVSFKIPALPWAYLLQAMRKNNQYV
jgi:hypothetical protein